MLLASPGKKRNGQSVARAPYAIHKCYLQMWGLYTFAQEQYLILVEEDEGVALYPHQNGGGMGSGAIRDMQSQQAPL